jgi:hypothetical protein
MAMRMMLSMAAVLSATLIAGAAYAADPMEKKEVDPSMKERIMQDAVKGDVLSIEKNNLVIRDTDGKEVRLHIDTSTKMEKVMEGDHVKAYVTDQGHVTTLERIKK